MAKKKEKKTAYSDIKSVIDLVDENKRSIAEKLLSRAEFMDKTLNELEKKIKADGAVIVTTNGNGFEVLSEHPAQRSYSAMIGRYNALIKTIIDMIPDGGGESDALLEFLGRGKK